ncbi:hypothetical protein ACFSFZ_02480 [Mixta tenebrionis]|jgi:hypothetical protein|uniref:DUF2190 family protein n=2 Tax=Enterobacterales TaxID=91347 RepID=A0A506V2B4_9GAMM|nr:MULTISPECIES: hypothetical protein [Erwiniaceae]EBQ3682365.1 hypothetical protein [Salmonella enterica]VFS44628.1 Uncharacterised protein [Enterobacter cancerogenus]ECH0717574.1 hypothetical protein [Salmonella enterica]MEA1064544.1 hypothetical protein [Erwinia sp. HR93]TPW39283.1 hypothetical protein FKM52_19395 [Mixta tenebrionis]
MTAITEPRDTAWRDCILVPVPVAKGEVIPMGAIVCVNATGFAVNGKEDATLKYAGCADESVDNSAGEDGAQLINVRANKAFKWASDGTITQASLLSRAYIVDNQTLSAENGGTPAEGETPAGEATRSSAGKIILIESDGVWIY